MAWWWPPSGLFSSPPEPSPSTAPIATAEGECANLNPGDLLYTYVRSIYLWRCVDMISMMAASVPLIVVKEDESQLTAQQQNIGALLRRPNPQWNQQQLQYFVAASVAVANEAFLLRVRGTGGITLELWPLLKPDVNIVYKRDSRMIEAFDVMDGTRQRRYPVDQQTGDCDVIYLRRPSLNPQTNKSPAAIAEAPAEVYTRILQRCADIVSNSSNITGMLSTDAELGKKAVEDIKDNITKFKTGSSQSGGTLVTANAKWSLTRLSEDPSSALSVAIKDSIARDVVMTFGVPTQLVGLPGTDTYNNLAMARVGFLTDTVLPGYVGLYTAGLNHALMRDGGAEIMADVQNIPAMMEYQRQLVKTAVEATMLSINEQREMVGYPPYEGEDDDLANEPVALLQLRLKRMAIEIQGGNVANILTPTSRGPQKEPTQGVSAED